MAAARERASRVIPADIELPVAEAPQYVNADGYEVDAQTFAQALQRATEDLLPEQKGQASASTGGGTVVNVEEEETVVDEEAEIVGQEQRAAVENAEPLLDLSER